MYFNECWFVGSNFADKTRALKLASKAKDIVAEWDKHWRELKSLGGNVQRMPKQISDIFLQADINFLCFLEAIRHENFGVLFPGQEEEQEAFKQLLDSLNSKGWLQPLHDIEGIFHSLVTTAQDAIDRKEETIKTILRVLGAAYREVAAPSSVLSASCGLRLEPSSYAPQHGQADKGSPQDMESLRRILDNLSLADVRIWAVDFKRRTDGEWTPVGLL